MISYLSRRGQRYYYRQRVPVDLFPHLNQQCITVSLKTSQYDQAKRRVRDLTRSTEELFTSLRLNMLTDAQIQHAVRKFKDKILDGYKRHRDLGSNLVEAAMSGDVYSLESPGNIDLKMLRQFDEDRSDKDFETLEQHYSSMLEALRKFSREAMRYGEINPLIRDNVHIFAAQTGLNLDMEMPPAGYFDPNDDESYRNPTSDFKRVAQSYMAMLSDILTIEIQRLQGIDTDYDRQRREELSKPNKTLSELCADILKEQQDSTRKTSWMKVDQHHRALLRILPDKNLREYTERDITDAAAIVRQWPNKATLAKDLDGIPAAEIIKRTDLGAPITYNMIEGRLTQLCSTFKAALERGLIDRNPCPRLSKLLPEDDRTTINDQGEHEDGNQHAPWSTDEILRLLSTSYLAKPQHRLKTPENFWLPLLALHTGCRLNEIAQLYCDDLLQHETGIWLVRIVINKDRKQEVKGKRKKHKNSVRIVPIHKTLIDLGILDYRDWIAKQGHDRLFPNLPFHADTTENYSNNWSKRFGKHTKRHVTWDDPEQSKVFHGFRASFVRTLRFNNGVHFEDVDNLTGHASQHKMGAHYAGKAPAVILNEHLQRLDYGIDFVELLGKWTAP